MTIPTGFVESWEAIPAKEAVGLTEPTPGTKRLVVELRNEVRPVDLYCYLGGRFGPPNGIQNYLRADDSDNIFHWHWIVRASKGFVEFLGMNFRTEVHLIGIPGAEEVTADSLAQAIKANFSSHGPRKSEVYKMLEQWVEFVNPYQRLRRAVTKLTDELKSLNLDSSKVENVRFLDAADINEATKSWQETASRYSRGLGYCFGIRAMLPVMAEAFVNLLLYILMRPEIRTDDRLWSNTFRQPIDVRVKSLSINCVGFSKTPDYSADPCSRYHSLVNERNDLLHGNVVIDKLKFNEVYFNGTVPVFKEYRSMWQRSVGVEAQAVGLSQVFNELSVIDAFIAYLMSCIHPDYRESVEILSEQYEIGRNQADGRLGILFPGWLVDFGRLRRSDLQGRSEMADNDSVKTSTRAQEVVALSLEPLTEEHFSSPVLNDLLRTPSIDLRRDLIDLEQDGFLGRAIVVASVVVGMLTVFPNGEASIVIHPDHQKKGYATEAARLAKDIVLSEKKFRSATARTRIGRPSNQLLERFGAVEIQRTATEVFYKIDLQESDQNTGSSENS